MAAPVSNDQHETMVLHRPVRHAPTIVVDLDGTLVPSAHWFDPNVQPLPGVHERLIEWWQDGCYVLIMTGRPECMRERTVKQLLDAQIFYHQLVMGVSSGPRYVINDVKPYDQDKPTALAINVERDKGLENVEIAR